MGKQIRQLLQLTLTDKVLVEKLSNVDFAKKI